jgi:hypothetical protein
MPILIFLRRYGIREYGITLTVAAIAGLGLAAMLNSTSGGDSGEALLKPKTATVAQKAVADSAPAIARETRIARPVATTRHRTRKHAHRHRRHGHARRHSAPAPAPSPAPAQTQLVVQRTPAPQPQRQAAPKPAPAPVVHTPAPKPVSKPTAAPKPSGGSVQFDDSG